MKKWVIMFLIVVVAVPSVQAGPMTEEELASRMPDLFMLIEGGPRFVLKDGIVVAEVYEWNPKDGGSTFLNAVELAPPAVVKAFLRGVIEKDLANLPTDYRQEAFFYGAIRSLGRGALKDPTAQPLLKRMVFDSKLPSDIRSTAMDTLAAIDFEGNLEMFFEVVELTSPEDNSTASDSYELLARRGTPPTLDRLETRLLKARSENFKAMVRRLIAKRRAELAGEEKKE